jgi:hypothetical protein
VLVGAVVEDQLGDHAQAAAMRLAQQHLEVAQRAVGVVDGGIVGDVVAVVAQRRRIERQQPQRGDAEVAQVIEPLREAPEVADAVGVAVAEGLGVQLVDDRVLVPGGIAIEDRVALARCHQSLRQRK